MTHASAEPAAPRSPQPPRAGDGDAAATAAADATAAIDHAIEAYAVAACRRLVDAHAAGLAELAEPPRTAAPDRATRLLAPLAETLAGFAIGRLAGALLSGVRRWFGDELAHAAGEALHALERRGWPAIAAAPDDRVRDLVEGRPAYLADAAARPRVDALAARLHPRLCRTAADLRALAAAVRAAVEARAPDPTRTLVVMFQLLRDDDLVAQRLREELAAGWAQYRAAVSELPAPGASPLWAEWARRVRGERAAVTPIEDGYIALIG